MDELYIKRKIKYVKFEYDIFIKQTKLSIEKFIHVLVGKKPRSEKIHIIQITHKKDIKFEFGRFIPSQMYHLVNMGTWGQWELKDIYKQKLNEYYETAINSI
jgi:hypothetical protein